MNTPSTWRLILTERQINDCVQKCADYINPHFHDQDVVVVCILKGAVYFFVDLKRKLTFPHSDYHIEASSYKNSQTQQEELEILSVINPDKFRGKKVILVDELYDNGRTLHNIKLAIAERAQVPMADIFTCTAFRKNKTTLYPAPDLCGLTMPDVWLVGYGLDDRQKYRNLTELYACPKAPGLPETEDDRRIFG